MAALLFLFLSTFAFAADTYYCPMHCEGTKTYSKPGKCPVCGMDLEKATAGSQPLNSRNFRVDVTTSPSEPKANGPVAVTFSLRRTKDDSPIKELEPGHGADVRLAAVSQDLSWAAFDEPKPLGDGNYRADLLFPSGGNYVLFLRFTPKGEARQVFPLALQVQGTKRPEKTLKESSVWKGEGYTVTLKKPAKLVAGESVVLDCVVKKQGKQVKGVQAEGGFIVSDDTSRFVDVHPAGGSEYRTNFAAPGLYKMWAKLNDAGKTLTPDFVIRVK